MNTFRTRTLTAIIFAAIMLGGILWNEYSFFVLFFCINFFSLQEYFRLIIKINPGYNTIASGHIPMALLSGCAIMLAASGALFHRDGLQGSTIGCWLLIIFLVALIAGELLLNKKFLLKNLGYTLLGLIYLSFPFGLMISLRLHSPSFLPGSGTAALPGYAIPLSLILAIWINDTMAYIVGSLIGKTKFFPSISPKKTWEGTLGGIILTMAVAALFSYFSKSHPVSWIAIGGIAAIAGTIGDLLESKLKRLAGVKDSGNIMPGHGGFLDRFDSMVLAIPFVWVYVVYF